MPGTPLRLVAQRRERDDGGRDGTEARSPRLRRGPRTARRTKMAATTGRRVYDLAVRHIGWLVLVVGCYTSAPHNDPRPIVLHPAGPESGGADEADRDEALAAGGSQPANGDPPTVTLAGGNELVLLGTDRAALDAARTHAFDRVCVQDQTRIAVDGSARIELTSDRATVIGGAGIGPRGSSRARIEIVARGAPEVFVLFDNAQAPIDAVFDAPNSTVHAAITGKTGLTIGGRTKSMVSHAGWGLPPVFPACDASSDREPEPSYPASKPQPTNCVGSYTSSNYVTPQPGRDELHIIGVYEGSKHVDGTVDVHVPARRRPPRTTAVATTRRWSRRCARRPASSSRRSRAATPGARSRCRSAVRLQKTP